MMEDKSLFVYDYVNLKNRQLIRKHGKKRSLGDVNGKYRYHAPQQTSSVMGSLINLDFPETRAINTKSANAIISDQSQQIRNTYQKTFRASTLDAWSRPESSVENRPYSSLDNRPQTAPDSLHDLQPQVNNRINNNNSRPHTTGNRNQRTPSRKPPHPSGFMLVKMKPDGSIKNMGFKSVTQEIREWWEEDDKKQREKARKAHSQNLKRYDSFAGQWLSFAGENEESEGVIEAFTGKVPKDEFYSIESRVGASVATQLKKGNKVRVGVNGTLQSDSLRVKKWKNDPDTTKDQTVEDIFREARARAPSPVPFQKETEGKVRTRAAEDLVPLSWTEQVAKPNVKVMELIEASTPPAKPDLSERHPVVFHPLMKDGSKPQRGIKLGKYRINQQSRSKIGIDGAQSLNNRITHVTIDQIDRADSEYRELTDADYENLLKEKLRSVSMEADSEDNEEDDAILESVSPRRVAEDVREAASICSIGKESEASGLTVEKPASARPQGSTDIIGVTQISSRAEKPYVRQVASAMPGMRQARSNDAQLTAPPRSMIRSAGSQRIQPPIDSTSQRLGARSAGSQRALSSASSRIKYSFDQKVTPRNAHSPRPNLARPGHLPRTKVSSISTGPQEGDAEYIKISQQILKPGDGQDRDVGMIAQISDFTQGQFGNRDPSISSMDEGGSVDSMNVHRGDPHQEKAHYHEDGTKCTCSPEAKRVMSAALSAMSHVSADHSVINIPTAPMTPTDSDRNSLSDMDPLSSTSSFRRASLGEEDWKESSFDEGGQVAESGDHGPGVTEVSSPTPSKEIVINRHDGLDSLGITPPRSAGKKRTVKFSDEVDEPFVPYTSPISTPRDPHHPGSAEGSLHSGEFVHADNRPDLTASGKMSGEAAEELNELRAKIKADLQKSQAETEQDLREMKSPAPAV
ncbi:uncharacterized protein LOC121423720 isoform X2 [Lytechinus variegatus]|uniref:uncharacterized protein LOC121423720 isoform X2 n=1 Tax=Lytechinus variegatus TaxID=7654 RepID=UPI001BB18393|nr:uncharacterized protein LOC121423720 isoform X2 [Lytechinus variegatus]